VLPRHVWCRDAIPFEPTARSTGSVGEVIRLLSRNGKDFTKRFASIARALEALPDDTAIDGEIVAYGEDGRPSFNVLQNHRAGPELHLYAFDLLTLRGRDLTRETYEVRREILRTKVVPLFRDSIRYSEALPGTAKRLRFPSTRISIGTDSGSRA